MAKESIKRTMLALTKAHLRTVWSMGSALELTRVAIKYTPASGKMGKEVGEEFWKITRKGTSMRACGHKITNGVLDEKRTTL